MTRWEKSPEPLVQLFGRVLPEDPAVERRQMFGYPCAFVRGNMFAGLFAKEMFVRLSAEERLSMMADQGAKPFEPMPGRAMKDYIVVPAAIMTSETALEKLVAQSLAYVKSLAPKIKKGGAEKAPGERGRRSRRRNTG